MSEEEQKEFIKKHEEIFKNNLFNTEYEAMIETTPEFPTKREIVNPKTDDSFGKKGKPMHGGDDTQ